MDDDAAAPIVVGVSACLLGERVRFDAQHKREAFLTDQLARFVTFVPVCPEIESGMGVPRETVRLVRGAGSRSLMVGNDTGVDYTVQMERYAEARVGKLETQRLSGYVLKSKSPSCGMERVKLYDAAEGGSHASKDGVGLFARTLIERFPDLPVEEEGRLHDHRLRENFIERIFAYHRLSRLFSGRWTVGQLVSFHTAHKLALLAHSPAAYQDLGRLVARAKSLPREELKTTYQRVFMAGLKKLATTGRHTNVLQHMAGYLRERVDEADRAEVDALIRDYRAGLVPLVVPLTLLRHHVGRHKIDYLLGQTYLAPHPKELMLRNHV